jgi:hypothetical protein
VHQALNDDTQAQCPILPGTGATLGAADKDAHEFAAYPIRR